MSASRPLEERFWEKVKKAGPDDCWEWVAYRQKFGYGQILFERGTTRYLLAHRVSWYLEYGELPPDGMLVCHRCDNPPCVNPTHLFLGTYLDNNRDAHAKGRARRHRGPLPFCKKGGHRMEGDNVLISPRGVRRCRVCSERWREGRKRAKEAD